MCGICGMIGAKPAREDVLIAMRDSMTHRGPDDAGIFVQEGLGLGHRRLAILDLTEAGHQPMTSVGGKTIIVYNGEVYNFREVAQKLSLNMRSESDTEVLVEGYERLGPALLPELNGMFAMAIANPEEDELFLARDRMGIKPLYYAVHDGCLYFASELKGLVANPDIRASLKINQQAIRHFLHLGYIPDPLTIYENIHRLPSGHYALWKNNTLSLHRWWDIHEQVAESVITDFSTARDRFLELLESSVRYRLISDVPVGTFLSGGIDSSLVTTMASRVSPDPVRTFTIGFKGHPKNEAEFAAAFARHLGTEHHEEYLDLDAAVPLLQRGHEFYDEPYADSSFAPTMMVSEMARKHVTVALSGDGGDELSHGYGVYQWAGRLEKGPLKFSRGLAAAALKLGPDRYRRVAQLVKPDKKASGRSHLFSQEQYFFRQDEIERFFPNLRAEPFAYVDPRLKRSLTPAENQALFDLQYYLRDDLLVKVDRASMQHSLEVRVPLLDHRIVTFMLNVDPELKIRDGRLKHFLREVLCSLVPRELVERPKWGFGVPMAQWMRQGDLARWKDKLREPHALDHVASVNEAQVQQLLEQLDAGDHHLHIRVWELMLLQKFAPPPVPA